MLLYTISRGCNEQAAIKAGRKMAKIFEKEYFTERVTATVDNTNTEGITLDVNSINSTIPVTVNCGLTNANGLHYGIITSNRLCSNAVIGTVNGVAV